LGFIVKWLGHASFQIIAGKKNIYIDPFQGEYKNKADIILVTHSHPDHCDSSKIELIQKDDTLIIAPKDCTPNIEGEISSLKPGEKLVLENIKIEAVEAYNYKRFRSPGIPFHPRGLGVGYLITIEDKTIYYAGDTDLIPEMKRLRDVYLALLPCGDKYTMDSEEAAEAALTIRPKILIPMHPLDTSMEDLKTWVESSTKIKVLILEPEEHIEVT
jgi:L-ascorbate metabolism protein UlaG (beta-lactamase superfamily)